LNQDVIENTFFVFRQRGGSDKNVTAKTFRVTFKMLSNTKLTKPSILSNCEADDDRNIVIDTVVNQEDNTIINNNENEEKQSDSSLSSFSLSPIIKKEENIVKPIVTLSVCSDSYFNEYLGKKCFNKFQCIDCQNLMLSLDSINCIKTDCIIFYKNYGLKTGDLYLKRPTENFLKFITEFQTILIKIVQKKPFKIILAKQ